MEKITIIILFLLLVIQTVSSIELKQGSITYKSSINTCWEFKEKMEAETMKHNDEDYFLTWKVLYSIDNRLLQLEGDGGDRIREFDCSNITRVSDNELITLLCIKANIVNQQVIRREFNILKRRKMCTDYSVCTLFQDFYFDCTREKVELLKECRFEDQHNDFNRDFMWCLSSNMTPYLKCMGVHL